MNTLIVSSFANWISEDFREGLDSSEWSVVRDYGLDIPQEANGFDAWWMPAGHAARVKRVMPGIGLTAPGPDWLTTVPHSLTGRSIASAKLFEFLSAPISRPVWVKPSEAKLEAFPAGLETPSSLAQKLKDINIDPNCSVQWSDAFIDFNHEYRCHVLDGEVLTISPYLVDGKTYYDGASWDMQAEALEFAEHAVDILGDNQPDAYVLDVGLNIETGEWIVVEGNPAWCSAIYGCSVRGAVETIMHSCQGVEDSQWLWRPDAELTRVAERKVALKFDK